MGDRAGARSGGSSATPGGTEGPSKAKREWGRWGSHQVQRPGGWGMLGVWGEQRRNRAGCTRREGRLVDQEGHVTVGPHIPPGAWDGCQGKTTCKS